MLLVGSFALATSAYADSDPPADAPVVKLVAAGNAPTKTLRLVAKPRFHQTVTMSMAMGMGIQSGGKDIVPMTRVPEVRMTLDLAVASVAANGDMRCTFKIRKPELAPDPSANPAVVAAMKKTIVGMDGISGYAVITNRGFTKEADFKLGPNIDPQLKELLDGMRQSLRQLAAPLPAEAVGKGARWETTTKLALNGMSLTQVATYDLVELSGDSAKLTVTMKQTAGRQTIQRNGVSVDLISLASSGAGDMTLDLGQLIASPATISIESASEMEAAGQRMSMKIDMTLGVKRK
jgi:hypothetical protein